MLLEIFNEPLPNRRGELLEAWDIFGPDQKKCSLSNPLDVVVIQIFHEIFKG